MKKNLLLLLVLISPILSSYSKTTKIMNRAFIVIDIQNDYFEGGAYPLVGSSEASLQAKKVLDYCRQQGITIVHIQHLSNREGAGFFVSGTQGADIHPNVKPLKNEKVITKHFPNSFRDTGLQEFLQEQNITNLILCGMMTSMCVDATTRAAKDLGYECTLIGDACAAPDLTLEGKTVNGKDVHTAFLAALNYFYAKVVSAEEFVKEPVK